MNPAGWVVYSIFVLGTFLILKVINMRLHLSLGTDPVPEEEEEEQEDTAVGDEGEGEGQGGEANEKSEKAQDC